MRANQLFVLQHRNGDECPIATQFNGCNDFRVALDRSARLKIVICGLPDAFQSTGEDHIRLVRTTTARRGEWWVNAVAVVRGDERKGSPSQRNMLPKLASQMPRGFGQHGSETRAEGR